MFPHRATLAGLHVEIWDLALRIGTVVGYFLVRAAFELPSHGAPGRPRWLVLRYLVVAYLAVTAAQLFSYGFDRGTTLAPPPTLSWAYYYLSPVAGAKTFYGVLVVLPLAIALISFPWRRERYVAMLDRWTPPPSPCSPLHASAAFFRAAAMEFARRSSGFASPRARSSTTRRWAAA